MSSSIGELAVAVEDDQCRVRTGVREMKTRTLAAQFAHCRTSLHGSPDPPDPGHDHADLGTAVRRSPVPSRWCPLLDGQVLAPDPERKPWIAGGSGVSFARRTA